MKFALFYGLFGICLQLTNGSSRDIAELNLITNVVLRNYSKQVLPLVTFEKPVKVAIQLIIRRLVEVSEKHQFITMYSGVMIKWNNPLLRWDPKQHEDIEFLHLQPDHVWVPDICLYNTLDDSGNLASTIDTAVKIHFAGDSTWLAPLQFKSECKIDVKFFPFDHQVCDLEFGSWTYDGHHIDIDAISEKLDFSQLVENPAWHVVDVLVVKKVNYFPQPYPSVTYRFVMKRRILYYLTNLIIPCVIITFLAFLSFCLPVQSGERIALVITMLLSMTVYMLLVFEFMPPTSEVIPLVGKFYLACIIEISLCLVATFLTVKWYYNETPIPTWIRCLVNNYLGSVLFFEKLKCTKDNASRNGYLNCNGGKKDHGALKENGVISDEGMELENNISSPMLEEVDPVFTESAKRSLAIISDKVRESERVNGLRNEWEYASKVLDRFFFILFLALFLFTAVFILWNVGESKEEVYRKTLLKSS